MAGTPGLPLGIQLPGGMGQLQREDPSLDMLLQKAEADECHVVTNMERYVLIQGVLYWQQGTIEQLVVPRKARDLVLTMGHGMAWGSHVCQHKTLAKHFW